MLKKKLMVLALLAGLSVGALHAQLSVGGGFIMDIGQSSIHVNAPLGIATNVYTDLDGFGAYAFVGGRFLEFSMGFLGGSFQTGFGTPGTSVSDSFFAMDLSLLGRLPLSIGRVTLAPLLGIGGQLVFTGVPERPDGPSFDGGLSNFRILFGLGVDVDITGNIFFRSNLLPYVSFPSPFEDDVANALSLLPGVNANVEPGFGFQMRLGVGFRF